MVQYFFAIKCVMIFFNTQILTYIFFSSLHLIFSGPAVLRRGNSVVFSESSPLCLLHASCLACVLLLVHPVFIAGQQCRMAQHNHDDINGISIKHPVY